MDLCLNLCELLSREKIESEGPEALVQGMLSTLGCSRQKPDRIYLGSSFCSQYFKTLEDAWEVFQDYIEKEKIPITLTVPVFSQKDLSIGKRKIERMLNLSSCIDEITVNDIGMLGFAYNEFEKTVNLGRLFFKDPRDPRSRHFREEVSTPMGLSFIELYPEIGGIELDILTRQMDLGIVSDRSFTLALHSPYSYWTTGNICKFASIGAETEKKFRPNMPCSRQCLDIHESFRTPFQKGERPTEIFRVGKTAYFKNDDYRVYGADPDRVVYFPLKMFTTWNGGRR